MENLRNRIDVKPGSNKKDYLKWASNQAICQTKYLTLIVKKKVTLTLNQPV